MSYATLKLKYEEDWKPMRLFTKDEVFEYFDILFDFFSQPRNDLDHMLLNIYLSNLRSQIDKPQQKSESSDISPKAISPPLDYDTLREKRLKAVASKTYVETPYAIDKPEETKEKEENKEKKGANYWVSMKLPVWASQRTRELRANLLGLSIDEV